MIGYVTGNILNDDAEALVNPVNCVGVAGKGLALAFRRRFPGSYATYRFACAGVASHPRAATTPGGQTMTDPVFVDELLKLFAEYDAHDSLWWSAESSGEIRFFVLVSDVFWWGTADLEQITPETIADLRSAFRDAASAVQHGEIHGDSLFAARARKMRPQGAVYERLPRELWPLFDACGPEREVDVCNPKAQLVEANP